MYNTTAARRQFHPKRAGAQTVQAAARWVRDFRPHIVYPYHYRSGDGTQADVQQFRQLVGDASEVRLRDWY